MGSTLAIQFFVVVVVARGCWGLEREVSYLSDRFFTPRKKPPRQHRDFKMGGALFFMEFRL